MQLRTVLLALAGMSVAVDASALRGRPEFDLLVSRQNRFGGFGQNGGNAGGNAGANAGGNAGGNNGGNNNAAAQQNNNNGGNNGGNNNAASMYPHRDAMTA